MIICGECRMSMSSKKNWICKRWSEICVAQNRIPMLNYVSLSFRQQNSTVSRGKNSICGNFKEDCKRISFLAGRKDSLDFCCFFLPIFAINHQKKPKSRMSKQRARTTFYLETKGPRPSNLLDRSNLYECRRTKSNQPKLKWCADFFLNDLQFGAQILRVFPGIDCAQYFGVIMIYCASVFTLLLNYSIR